MIHRPADEKSMKEFLSKYGYLRFMVNTTDYSYVTLDNYDGVTLTAGHGGDDMDAMAGIFEDLVISLWQEVES